MNILTCPRCGEHKLEILGSHCFCWECGYSPDGEPRPTAQIASIHRLFQKAPVDEALEQVLERAS
jgi:hypothetical protein